ncbi:MAG: NrsF family protein [Kofleriaceae bacterium]
MSVHTTDHVSDPISDLAARPLAPPPAIGGALERELAHLGKVGTRRPLRQLSILVVLSLVYAIGLVVVTATRGDLHQLPMGWLVGAGAGWLFGFLVPSYLALVPRAGSVTPRWQPAAVAAVIASIGFIILGLVIHPMGDNSLVYGWDRFGHGHTCLKFGLATALVPVVVGAIFLRGVLPIGSRWIAAALGAGGGCLGGLVLHFHCRVADGLHVGLVHGGVVVIAALLSAAIVPRASSR